MARRTNTKLKEIEKANLKIAEKPQKKAKLKVAENPIVKNKPYNDIDLNNWKNYSHIKTDTLWLFPSRDKSGRHSNTTETTFHNLLNNFLNVSQRKKI